MLEENTPPKTNVVDDSTAHCTTMSTNEARDQSRTISAEQAAREYVNLFLWPNPAPVS